MSPPDMPTKLGGLRRREHEKEELKIRVKDKAKPLRCLDCKNAEGVYVLQPM